MAKRIVVVGSINLDLVAATQRIPIAGETVAGSTFRTFPGGKGANQAVAAARLGGAVSMIGKLGDDPFGVELRQSLERANVNTESVRVVAGSSGIALITTDATGQNAITVVAGANAQLCPADLEANVGLILNAGVVLTQLEIPLETVECLAEITTENGVPLILDPAPARSLPRSLVTRVEWITPNETETCSLTGQRQGELVPESMEKAADVLMASGCRNVILKLGARGCYVALVDGTRRHLPAYTVKAVDTTAAGDAFNGAFAVALMDGRNPVESAEYASAVAAISVTRHGAQTSMPTAAEVEGFVNDAQSAEPRY